MNTPNKLSLTRIALIPLLVALMYPNQPLYHLLSAAVFGIAAITDYFDGHLARKYHLVTDFGKFVDPVADKLLTLCAFFMLAYARLLPMGGVLLILARELCVDGLRMVAVGQGHVIAAGKLGKIKTASQMVLILWLMVLRYPVALGSAMAPVSVGNVLEAWGLQLPGLLCWISTLGFAWVVIITLWSGVEYFVRNAECIKQVK